MGLFGNNAGIIGCVNQATVVGKQSFLIVFGVPMGEADDCAVYMCYNDHIMTIHHVLCYKFDNICHARILKGELRLSVQSSESPNTDSSEQPNTGVWDNFRLISYKENVL